MISKTAAAARAKVLHAQAEDATHPRDKAALRSAAAAWERIAGPSVPWSVKVEQRELRKVRLEVVNARGPFQPPREPRAPSPQALPLPKPEPEPLYVKPAPATIEF